MKAFRYFLLATTIVIFLLVVLGNVVRVSDAAQACPDWPTCFGQFAWPVQTEARLQVLHRALAALAALLVTISAGWAVRRKAARIIVTTLSVGAGLMAIEIFLGAGLALAAYPLSLAGIHLALALGVLGLAVTATTAAYGLVPAQAAAVRPGLADAGDASSENIPLARPWGSRFSFRSPFSRLSLAAALAVFVVLVSGAVVVAGNAPQACSGWPLCGGGLPVTIQGWLAFSHRLVTGAAGLLVILLFWNAWRTQRSQRVILSASSAVFVLFLGQGLIGAAKVLRGFPTDLVGLHAGVAAGLWAVLAVLVTAAGLAGRTRAEEAAEGAHISPIRQRAKDFFLLNKPLIVLLLLVTTYAGMVLGGRKLPDFNLTFWTLLGGALAAGGASALNQYIDRELDKNMQRTARRPLPSGRMTAGEGIAYGLAACLAAFVLVAVYVNLLAALLSLAGMIYYVLLYSIWLKKLTVQNIVIGGGAGAIPPLVGWAAAAGSLNIPSLFLFAIVFLWTPPHFWALALVRQKDYARAGVPMLPVVQGEKAARWQILVYTLELVGLTLLMPALHITGAIFLYSALGLGAWLLSTAWRVWKTGGNKIAWKMYRYSSMYLAFLFLALVLDVLL